MRTASQSQRMLQRLWCAARLRSQSQSQSGGSADQPDVQGLLDLMQQGGAPRPHEHSGPPGSMFDQEARRVMRDPTAALMMSRGVPFGIKLRVSPDQHQQHHHQQGRGEARSSAPAPAGSDSEERAPPPEREQLRELLQQAEEGDSWGTTVSSAAEIAQRIADSNAHLGGGGGGGGGDEEDGDADLRLSATEERVQSVEALQADLKHMDEIFEMLAQVPWLDDRDVDEHELRGVVTVGLLGTLEEVGWNIRAGVERIWAGERDGDVLSAGLEPREAAAMVSILYHTQRLELKYGAAPVLGSRGGNGADSTGSGAPPAAPEGSIV